MIAELKTFIAVARVGTFAAAGQQIGITYVVEEGPRYKFGTIEAYNHFSVGWAHAMDTPYQWTKQVASHWGGTRNGTIVHWPKGMQAKGEIRTQFAHVIDVAPTILEAAGIPEPVSVDGITQDPIDGTSMLSTFNDAGAPEVHDTQYFEVMGSRSYYQDDWIASVFGPRAPWVPGVDPAILKWTPDQDTWELHDLSKDFSQAKDVAKDHPQKVEELQKAFSADAEANKVYPVGGGLWSVVFHPEDAPRNPATEFHYTQEVFGVPEFTAPKVGARSNLVTIETELTADSQGVLYALGAFSGGLALWVDQGKLSYEYNLFEVERTLLESSAPLPTGKVKIEVETHKLDDKHAGPLSVAIRIDGKEVIKGQVPRSAPLTFTANDAFDVGRDSYSPVSLAYFDRKPFKFNGEISSLKVAYLK